MILRPSSQALLLAALALMGCTGSPPAGSSPAGSPPAGSRPSGSPMAQQRGGFGQIDEGGYIIRYDGTAVAWMFAVADTQTKDMKEYWLRGGNWPKTAQPLTIEADTNFEGVGSCQRWRVARCSASGVTAYSQSVPFKGTPVDDFCKSDEPQGATPFLWSGSYQANNSANVPFAWVYVGQGDEVWAMNSRIGRSAGPADAGLADTLSSTDRFSKFNEFKSFVCSQSPRPQLVFQFNYRPDGTFCNGGLDAGTSECPGGN